MAVPFLVEEVLVVQILGCPGEVKAKEHLSVVLGQEWVHCEKREITDSYCSDSACPSWKLSTGKSQQELWKVWGESLLNRLGCQPCLRYWLYRGDCTNTDISTKSVLKLSI